MIHSLYNIAREPKVIDPILEEMRVNIARGQSMGVTLMGNRLTVRFSRDGFIKEVHMVILEVDDGLVEEEIKEAGEAGPSPRDPKYGYGGAAQVDLSHNHFGDMHCPDTCPACREKGQ